MLFSPREAAGNVSYTRLAEQSSAEKLNHAPVKFGRGEQWRNAYEALELPDSLSGVWKEIHAAFGRDIRSVAPTYSASERSGGKVYFNIGSDIRFIQIAAHKRCPGIERTRATLIRNYSDGNRIADVRRYDMSFRKQNG